MTDTKEKEISYERKCLMASVFQKLLRKEFGESNYYRYLECFRKNAEKPEPDTSAVFQDIVTQLESRDEMTLSKMQKRLEETLLYAYRINRTYLVLFFAYLGASLFLILQSLNPIVTVAALALLSICFVVKTHEFIANKYCYLDARIILIYKAVLDQMLDTDGAN